MDINIKIECPNCGKDLGENIKERNRYGDLEVVLVPDMCEKCFIDISSFDAMQSEFLQGQAALQAAEYISEKHKYELELALDKISKLELMISDREQNIDAMTKIISDLEGGTSHEVEPPIVI